jgi:hypothetical protein
LIILFFAIFFLIFFLVKKTPVTKNGQKTPDPKQLSKDWFKKSNGFNDIQI